MLVILIVLFIKFNYSKFFFIINSELIIIYEKKISILKSESSVHLNKFFNYPTNIINIIIIRYLFFLLIITVNITNFFNGPMRQK